MFKKIIITYGVLILIFLSVSFTAIVFASKDIHKKTSYYNNIVRMVNDGMYDVAGQEFIDSILSENKQRKDDTVISHTISIITIIISMASTLSFCTFHMYKMIKNPQLIDERKIRKERKN